MSRWRTLHPIWIALALAVVVVVWMASGMLGGMGDKTTAPGETASADAPAEPPQMQVRVRLSHAQPVMRSAELAGRTAAIRKVHVRAQIAGRVADVVAERGAYVNAGDVIVRLDAGDLQAQLSQAQALLEQRRLQYQAAQKMAAQGYQSAVGLATAKTNLQAARAQVARIHTQIDYTTIEAPFAGVLEQLPVELGDYVSIGDDIGQVIQQDPFIVWGQASEDVVALLEPGQQGTATLISGQTLTGTVRFISSVADKQTRTYRVELEIDKPVDSGKLIAGASAQLRLPLETVLAQRVEPAVLTLNTAGVFGIKSVDDDGVVHFHKARIVRNANGYIWLRGLPPTLRIITVGQGFVRAGDTVDYTLAQTDANTAPAAS